MDTKQLVSTPVLIAAIVLLLGFIGFMTLRSFGPSDNGSAPGGAAARTVAPQVQRYPDGTIVPYDAAPTGAIPGDPSSIRR
jgi:hypothetical protein